MNKDLVYAFDKLTKKGTILGEIQSDFNMSLVIDGTKDSCSVIVWSFSGLEIEPYTIILHQKTMSWWVVSHDKVERYLNDNCEFIYVHNLELLGAIELLNARDLTDCGFNDYTYTIVDFLYRLFDLSNIDDYNVSFDIDSTFGNKVVEFIKTFENYTLLSALREFLDAFNCACKLYFSASYDSQNDTYTIADMVLKVIYKTGERTRVHDIDEFDDVRETKTMDKNSFGACVVSNAENVVSSNAKTFPSTGSINISSSEYLIVDGSTINNGLIRLPSKVFKGNWIKLIYRVLAYVIIDFGAGDPLTTQLNYYPYDNNNFEKLINDIKDFVFQTLTTQTERELFNDFLTTHKEELNTKLNNVGTVTIYNGNDFNPITGKIIKGADVPYLATFSHSNIQSEMVFVDKDTRESLPDKLQGIAWERGSNLITGFDFLSSTNGGFTTITTRTENTDYMSNERHLITFEYYNLTITISLPQDDGITFEQIKMSVGTIDLATQLKRISFIINYYPMSDLKIKVDNQRDKRDIQLYNQNGRVTDCVALSKLINSYSKEISSDTITKYMHYYYSQGSFFSVLPNVGDIVMQGNDEYVINNISMDFTQNETNVANDFGYFIDCEITMSKWVSTKSLMVNPNTNIRDYGIPQNFNVKRKQLYRDYYELSYAAFDDADNNPYLPTDKIIAFGHNTNILADFIAVMKIDYSQQIEGQNSWYYQLETTNYYLDKMLCVMLDFQDNNIIGYGSQNVFSGFDITRVFTGMTDKLNTPISYVDDSGRFLGITTKLLTNEQLTSIYDTYQQSQAGGSSYDGSLYNYSVFIPHEIYDLATINNYSILIQEPNYYKDALEIPVFEYVCQIDDSEDVLIGDNILQQHDGFVYFYFYNTGSNLNQNNVDSTNRFEKLPYQDTYRQYNSAEISVNTSDAIPKLEIVLYGYTQYNLDTNNWSNDIAPSAIPINTDIAVFRRVFNPTTLESIIELMFIIKNVPASAVDSNQAINLMINHYKLK